MGCCGCSLYVSTVFAAVFSLLQCIYGIAWTTSLLVICFTADNGDDTSPNTTESTVFTTTTKPENTTEDLLLILQKFGKRPEFYGVCITSLALSFIWLLTVVALFCGNKNRSLLGLRPWVLATIIIILTDIISSSYYFFKGLDAIKTVGQNVQKLYEIPELILASLFSRGGPIVWIINIALIMYVNELIRDIRIYGADKEPKDSTIPKIPLQFESLNKGNRPRDSPTSKRSQLGRDFHGGGRMDEKEKLQKDMELTPIPRNPGVKLTPLHRDGRSLYEDDSGRGSSDTRDNRGKDHKKDYYSDRYGYEESDSRKRYNDPPKYADIHGEKSGRFQDGEHPILDTPPRKHVRGGQDSYDDYGRGYSDIGSKNHGRPPPQSYIRDERPEPRGRPTYAYDNEAMELDYDPRGGYTRDKPLYDKREMRPDYDEDPRDDGRRPRPSHAYDKKGLRPDYEDDDSRGGYSESYDHGDYRKPRDGRQRHQSHQQHPYGDRRH